MAVRHGYGKVAGTDALVFAYDTGDTRNSYRGEPTTNLASNADFSNGNTGWSANQNTTLSVETINNTRFLKVKSNQTTSTPGFLSGNITVSGNTTYTLTIRAYKNDSRSIWLYATGNGTGGSDIVWTSAPNGPNPITNTLTTISRTFTTPSDMTFLRVGALWSVPLTTSEVYIEYMQLEAKSHATQFVNGTRSATQGLLDLTGNYSVDLSNTSFNSSADIEFDASNDNITVNVDSVIRGYTAVTFESVHKDTTGTGGATPYSLLTSPNISNEADGFWQHWVLGGQWYWRLEDNVNGETGGIFSGSTPFQTGEWYHVVAVVKTNTILYYLNGILVHTVNTSFAWANLRTDHTAYLYLGSGYGNNYYFGGNLPVFKMYNRELTAAEVRNNYNQYRGRFNL